MENVCQGILEPASGFLGTKSRAHHFNKFAVAMGPRMTNKQNEKIYARDLSSLLEIDGLWPLAALVRLSFKRNAHAFH